MCFNFKNCYKENRNKQFSVSHFCVRGTSDQKNLNLSVSENYFVSQISQPPKVAEKWFCIQNLRMDLSFQEKKTICKSDRWLLRY